MKDAYVLHMTPCNTNSTLASCRIARFIAETLDVPLIDDKRGVLRMLAEKRTIMILVNGPSAFCKFAELLFNLADQAKELVWVENDYSIWMPTQVRTALYSRMNEGSPVTVRRWTTIPEYPAKWVEMETRLHVPQKGEYINWNSLTYREDMPIHYGPSVPGLFYYGAYRADPSTTVATGVKGREEYFKKYMGPQCEYPIHVSTTKKAAEKFLALNPKIHIYEPFEDLSWVSQFQMTIYMEDNYSHNLYCSLANRFYECLSARLPMLFESKCWNTLNTADIPFPFGHWWVHDHTDVAEKLASLSRMSMIKEQRDIWCGHYREDLTKRLLELASGIVG